MPRKLLIFTRYPVAGRAKTRLIPALGAAGAAALHRRLTERTLRTADLLTGRAGVALAIHHEGGSAEQMAAWLGPHRSYCPQGAGDLGAKMTRAFTAAFGHGCRQVVLIGSDCPGLSPELLESAFARLTDHDLVLGPACDGGYYLVGLTRSRPLLFTSRAWGTNLLLAETIVAAQKNGLTFFLLEELPDVDHPADLTYFGDYPNPE